MQKVQVGARISQQDYQRLAELAGATGQTNSEVIADAVNRYLGGRGTGGKMRSQLSQLSQQVIQLQGEVARLGAMIGGAR